jgi:LPXTG-motif cell wall-anchored protein
MRSPEARHRAAALVLVGTALCFALLGVWASVARSTIPLRLDGTVTSIDTRQEKRPGVDDAWFVGVDGEERHLDTALARSLGVGDTVRKDRWSGTLVVDGSPRALQLSNDAWAMSVLASVAVAGPVLTPPTCTAPGTLSYSDAVGYTWSRTDDHGNVVLTAIAKPGFTLVGQTSWTYTAAQLAKLSGANACPPAVVPPTVIPPKVEGVKHTAPPKAPVVEGVKHEAAATLPRTGSESGLYGAAGLLLLMVGSGLVLVTRKCSTEGRAH